MTVPVLLSAAPRNYLIDAGVVKTGSGLLLFGNTVGGLKWDPGDESRHVQFDGLRAEIRGQHRDIGSGAQITGKFLIGSVGAILSVSPGSSSDGSASATGVTTITPYDNDLFWPINAYQENGVYLARKQGNKIFGVLMPVFYPKTSGFQSQDKNETGWDIVIKPVIDDIEGGGTINLSEKPWRYLEIDELQDLVDYLTELEA